MAIKKARNQFIRIFIEFLQTIATAWLLIATLDVQYLRILLINTPTHKTFSIIMMLLTLVAIFGSFFILFPIWGEVKERYRRLQYFKGLAKELGSEDLLDKALEQATKEQEDAEKQADD